MGEGTERGEGGLWGGKDDKKTGNVCEKSTYGYDVMLTGKEGGGDQVLSLKVRIRGRELRGRKRPKKKTRA